VTSRQHGDDLPAVARRGVKALSTKARIQSETSSAGSSLATRQIAEALGGMIARRIEVAPDGTSFRSCPPAANAQGILSLSGRLVEGSAIHVRLELARMTSQARGAFVPLFRQLSELDEKIRILEPSESEGGSQTLAVELRTHASPLGFERETVLTGVMKQLDDLARQLQADLPTPQQHPALDKLYKPLEKAVAPVYPATDSESKKDSPRALWALEVHEFLASGCSVALMAPSSIEQDFALGLLAHAGPLFGTTLGRVTASPLNSRALLELVKAAPGTLAVPALGMSVGNNPYDLSSEIQSLLAGLQMERAVLFFGSKDELHRVFRGGQGSKHTPTNPVIVHAPQNVGLADHVAFAVREAGRRLGGLAETQMAEITADIQGSLAHRSSNGQLEILPRLVWRNVTAATSGRSIPEESTKAFMIRFDQLAETLGGVHDERRDQRTAEVDRRYLEKLSDPKLLDFFREHLFAQDRALSELVDRLRAEALMRPPHQPIRYCALGTSGNGKSESARLLANWLRVPLVHVDAASMSDHHTGSAQLLGSGRGIVGSHEPGRLEKAANHHAGAVVEVSDLDHAKPDVRSHLGDLFLQILENGEIQTATGAMVSCANLVLAFTMNLPDGLDARAWQPVGFGETPSPAEVGKRVAQEIEHMVSGAFVGRAGSPILFDPLTVAVLAQIAQHVIEKSIGLGLSRLQMEPSEILVTPTVGKAVAASIDIDFTSFGVRAVLEKARSLSAEAVMEVVRLELDIRGKPVSVSATPNGTLVLTTGQEKRKS